jgi:hypothetical protein
MVHQRSRNRGAERRPSKGRAGKTVRIEAYNRWDAIDLAQHLPSWSWYLVSQGRERWDVCVGADPRRQDAIRRLMDDVQEWANRREVHSIVHLGDRDLDVHPATVAGHGTPGEPASPDR